MNKTAEKFIKGRAQVRALRVSRRGCGEFLVPEGSIGYIVGHAITQRTYLIFWPDLKQAYKSDDRMSVHAVDDVQMTGARG